MFSRELRVNFKNWLIWSGIIIIFFSIVFLIYPSITTNQSMEQMDQLLKMFPEEVLSMFNMDISSINSVFGWIKTEGYMFLLLIGGMYSAILGSTILAKEERDKTIEFLASKPISRKKIITSKILAGLVNIVAFVLAITIFNLLGLVLSDDLTLRPFLLLSFAPLLLYLMLFSLSLCISTFLKNTKNSMGIGIAITFISFLMQILGGVSDKFEFIKSMSLFEFVSARYIIINNALDIKYIIIGIAIILLALLITYIKFDKKELF